MKVTNSYIFIKKEQKIETKEKNTIVINLDSKMPKIFEKIFNIPENDLISKNVEGNSKKGQKEFDKFFYHLEKNNFYYSFNGKKFNIEYKFLSVNNTYFLDLTVSDKYKKNIIKIFENFNDILLKDRRITKNYTPILSYDIVSEFYCNKIYPKLNNFERKIRKLLFLTYTSLFEKEYYKTTITEELQNSVKERIRKPKQDNTPKEEYNIQNFFYSLDYGNMIEMLFTKNWTDIENKKINKFLCKNENLREISDKELREFIQDIHPHSDWERFFSKKGFSEDFENIIKDINLLRNSVAHNKIFTKDMYNNLVNLLKLANKDINRAIKITENEDFRKINEEQFDDLMHEISLSFRKFTQTMLENINYMMENSILKQLKEMVNNK